MSVFVLLYCYWESVSGDQPVRQHGHVHLPWQPASVISSALGEVQPQSGSAEN